MVQLHCCLQACRKYPTALRRSCKREVAKERPSVLPTHGLKLNISKTMELIVDFSRKLQRSFHSLSISGDQEERVIASDTSVFMSPRTWHDPTA